MNIQVNEHYRIRRLDANNIVLESRNEFTNEKLAKRAGKSVGELSEWSVYSYHPSVESACNRLLNKLQHDSGAQTIEELKQIIINAKEEIKNAIQRVSRTSTTDSE